MTKVITRFFESADAARTARSTLIYRARAPQNILRLFDSKDDLVGKLTRAGVEEASAKAYLGKMGSGGAVLMVRAGFRPLGIAAKARAMMEDMGGAPTAGLTEEVEVEDDRSASLSILPDHPIFMGRPRDPKSTNYYMANWPIPLITKRWLRVKPVIPPHAHMANVILPLLIDRKPRDNFIFQRHARMANFPIPLISQRKPKDRFAFPRHARMANFPIPLTIRRTPRNPSIFPRHQRMANWPFPHLMSGKTGTNALMPGGPRMANFPMPLISKRVPKNPSIFGRHARMANFPISLISKRKPKDRFVFPRHARMADFPIPLIMDKVESPVNGKETRLSLSEILGIPTVVKRGTPLQDWFRAKSD